MKRNLPDKLTEKHIKISMLEDLAIASVLVDRYVEKNQTTTKETLQAIGCAALVTATAIGSAYDEAILVLTSNAMEHYSAGACPIDTIDAIVLEMTGLVGDLLWTNPLYDAAKKNEELCGALLTLMGGLYEQAADLSAWLMNPVYLDEPTPSDSFVFKKPDHSWAEGRVDGFSLSSFKFGGQTYVRTGGVMRPTTEINGFGFGCTRRFSKMARDPYESLPLPTKAVFGSISMNYDRTMAIKMAMNRVAYLPPEIKERILEFEKICLDSPNTCSWTIKSGKNKGRCTRKPIEGRAYCRWHQGVKTRRARRKRI